MGRSEEALLGLNNFEEAAPHLMSQEAVCETENVEITLMVNAKPHLGDGQADPITTTLNIKKCKQMARHVNQSSVLPQASRNAKRGRVELDVTLTTRMIGLEKRQKIMDATQGQATEILAAADVQPRQEP